MISKTASRLTLPVSERDHVKGPPKAPVTLLEYGDFECPYCGEAYHVVKKLERRLKNDMRFAFRNFPLTSVHPHAELAAEAAEAAGAQGKFWQMHDALFENQNALDEIHIREYAVLIGLNLEQFVRDLSEGRFAARVREDFLSGVRSGVNGTPTFFVNGLRYDGGLDFDSMLATLEYIAHESKRA